MAKKPATWAPDCGHMSVMQILRTQEAKEEGQIRLWSFNSSLGYKSRQSARPVSQTNKQNSVNQTETKDCDKSTSLSQAMRRRMEDLLVGRTEGPKSESATNR